MVRMIRGELKKMFSPIITVLLAVIMLVNFGMSISYQNEQDELYDNDYIKVNLDMIQKIAEAIEDDPQKIADYYAELEAEYEKQYAIWEEATDPILHPELYEGLDTIVLTFEFIAPNTFSPKWNDYDAIGMYYKALNDYPKELKSIIAKTEQNSALLESLGISVNTQTGVYQKEASRIYADLLEETDPEARLTLGWHNWFGYNSGILLVFIVALLLILQSGLCDHDSGMEMILRVAKRGRWQRGLAKASAFLIALTGIVLVMRLSDLAVFALPMGLSSPLYAVQNVRSMLYCPYAISILTAALLRIASIILTVFALSMACLICMALLRNAFVTVILGGALIAGNLLIYWLDLGLYYRYLGIFSLAAGELMQRTPDAVHIHMGKSLFGQTMAVYLAIAAVLVIVLMLVTGATRPKIRKRKQWKLSKIRLPFELSLVKQRPKSTLRLHTIGLMKGELYKHSSAITVMMLIALVGVHCVLNVQSIQAPRSDGEGKILALIEQYGTRVNEENLQQLQARLEYDELLLTDKKSNEVTVDYLGGKITKEEYADFMVERAQAQAEISILTEYVAHSNYLWGLEGQGVTTKQFYDGGYRNLLDRGFDITHYIIILLFCATTFAYEASTRGRNGMVYILRTTKRGRQDLLKAKMGASILFAGVIGVIFQVFDWIVMITRYGTEGMTSLLVCIEYYAEYPQNLLVWQYLLIYSVIRILTGILLAVWISSLTFLIPSLKLNLPIIVAVTLLPKVLIYWGVSACKYMDTTVILDGEQLLYKLLSEQQWSYSITPLVFALITIVLIFFAKRKFIR